MGFLQCDHCLTEYFYQLSLLKTHFQGTVVSLYATVSKLNVASLTGVQQQQHLI